MALYQVLATSYCRMHHDTRHTFCRTYSYFDDRTWSRTFAPMPWRVPELDGLAVMEVALSPYYQATARTADGDIYTWRVQKVRGALVGVATRCNGASAPERKRAHSPLLAAAAPTFALQHTV